MRIVDRCILIVLLVICFPSLNLFGQNSAAAKVELVASYDSVSQSILLRWAPNNSDLWFYANEYGYTLEKYVYQRDNKLLPTPLQQLTLGAKIKPEPIDNWESLVYEDDYAAIAAQTLFGEYISFEEASSDIFSIVNKTKEQEARFSMALFAADQSKAVAEKSGLFFQDFDIKTNERYLYRVYANVQDSIVPADTGRIFFGSKDYIPLPKPIMSHVEQENGQLQIHWFKAPYHDVFSNYIIQKSTNNKHFRTLNSLPVLNTQAGPTSKNQFGVFVDTTQLSGTVYYRVLGKDIFGQISEPSDTIEVQVAPNFIMPMPAIDSIYNNTIGEVLVNYSVQGDQQYANKVFLERSNKADGNYQLIEMKQDYEDFILKDIEPIRSNYYRIGIEAYGTIQYSMPSLFNTIDSIPPAQPIFEKYLVSDSLLTLSWFKNSESDIAGYRLYKAQFVNQEPSLVADLNGLGNKVVLKENLEFINNERYYYLVAVDEVGNASKMSLAFKIKLPDIIPPTSPLIKDIKVSNDTLQLEWEKSYSTDVKNYLIYIKYGKGSYKLKGIKNNNEDTFQYLVNEGVDQDLFFRVIAVDSSNNEGISKPFPYKIRSKTSRTNKPKFEVLSDDDGLQIYWETSLKSFERVKIYRKVESGFNLIKEVDYLSGKTFIEDKGVKASDIKLIFI